MMVCAVHVMNYCLHNKSMIMSSCVAQWQQNAPSCTIIPPRIDATFIFIYLKYANGSGMKPADVDSHRGSAARNCVPKYSR